VTRLAALVRQLVIDGELSGVHDVGAGGLGLALAEMAVRSGIGIGVDGVDGPAELLAEMPGRVVICVPAESSSRIADLASTPPAAVRTTFLGRVGGDRIGIEGLVDLALDDATRAWRDRIPAALDGPVASA
jgi:phosphoribosylformylglycinamidine synthase